MTPRKVTLQGNNGVAYRDTASREILLSGPAGTGKTLAALLKLYRFADQYPGARLLIVRKTRKSLTETGLVTWERDVLGDKSPLLARPIQRGARHQYTFPNGSVLVTGGMDRPDKVLSSEWDLVYVQEATELTLTDWENLGGRLRAGAGPFDQLVADCNPTTPRHWLYQRSADGKLRRYDSTHRDNPRYYDKAAGAWTEAGVRYMARLEQMTGHRRKRFLEGVWAQAEGVVYEGWDASVHVVDRFPVPKEWPRYLAVDFGYTNPFVCQWWAEDPDGRLYLYRELYRTKSLVEDNAKAILVCCGALGADSKPDWRRSAESQPRAVVCDHDAEDRATLERYLGIGTTPAMKAVTTGIQLVEGRLARAGDGKPRLFVMRDSLLSRDQSLVNAGKPCGAAEEFDGYVWDTREGRPPREEPVKDGDHSMDALRYLVAHRDGVRPEVRVY